MRNNDALFFANLLQLAIYLKHGDKYFLRKTQLYRYGGTTEYLDGACFIGLQQAVEFLDEIYQSNYFKDEEFVKHLKINPLMQKLVIDNNILAELGLPMCQFSASQEGRRITANQEYFQFETTTLFMSQVVFAMDRIITRQSHITKDTQDFMSMVNAYSEETGGTPQVFNQGSIKQYNATESAYFARAREIGGCGRFIDRELKDASDKIIKDSKSRDCWHLKSEQVVRAVNCEKNNKALASITPDHQVLIENGLYYLTKEQYLGASLLSFSLSGGLENTISSSAKSSGDTFFSTLELDGRLIDSYYQSIFTTDCLDYEALYGIEGNYRYLSNEVEKYQESSFRVRRNRVPQYKVDDIEVLKIIIEQFQQCLRSTDKNLYFRGQGKHHALERHPKINRLLYGNEKVNELSLPTSASREKFDFDTFYARFQMHVHAMMYADIEAEKFEDLFPDWQLWSQRSPCSNEQIFHQNEKWFKLYYSYEWDWMIMALAQHYTIPTHGLDITTDLNIALWFALNKWYDYQEEGKEYCWYKPLTREEKTDICDNPVIYLIATNKELKHDLDQVEFSGLQSLRPERQNAHLHYGGWGLHTNICGEDVIAAIHLSTEFDVDTLPTTEYMFPSPEEDPFYKQLLLLKTAAFEEGLIEGFSKIAEYKKEANI